MNCLNARNFSLKDGSVLKIVGNTLTEYDQYVMSADGIRSWVSMYGHAKPNLVSPGRYVIALLEDMVCGIAGWRRIGYIGEVMHLAVAPDFRGKGIGKILFLDREKALIDAGCKVILVNTREDNTIMRTMLDKLGYTPVFGYDHIIIWMRSV